MCLSLQVNLCQIKPLFATNSTYLDTYLALSCTIKIRKKNPDYIISLILLVYTSHNFVHVQYKYISFEGQYNPDLPERKYV